MFEQLITVGELLINGLSIIPLKRDKKKLVGKLTGSLYHDLTILLENGDKILRLFGKHNSGKNISIDEIKKLLLEQHVLIPRLTSVLRKRDIQTILSVKVPQISPLRFLLFAKGSQVKFYLEEIDEQEARGSEGDRIEWLWPRARIELPNNNSINLSKKQLRKIKVLTEELRKFIVKHFEINEII